MKGKTMFEGPQLRAALAKHGYAAKSFELAGLQGVANETWLCGDFVLRVSKNPDYLSDSFTESAAVPAVVAAGILTPKLLAFDQDLDVLPAVFSIYQRIPGTPLSKVWQLKNPSEFYAELGREIRKLHDVVKEVPDPNGYLDEEWELEPKELARKWPDAHSAALASYLIEDWFPGDPAQFCHQDLHPDNILVHEGKLSAILDWGDAGWASRAVDLRYIPAQYLRATLDGYGRLNDAEMFEVLLHQVDQQLYVQEENRDYGRWGNSDPSALTDFIRRWTSGKG